MGGGALEQGNQAKGISYAFELFPLFEAADALCPPPARQPGSGHPPCPGGV